jgi:hypothetical protein
MKRFPFALVATTLAFTATVGAQGPKAGTTGATKSQAGTHAPTTGGASAPTGSTHKPASSGASHKPTTTGSNEHGKSAKNASTPSTSTSAGTTASADAPEPNAVSFKVGGNPAQMARIQPQLDALGLTLEEATAGFRNQGQFLAALNVAKNRGLDFVALQEAMTVDGLSLGQAAKKVQNTPPAPVTPDTGDTGTGSTGGTGTGSTGGTGSTDTGSTGTGSTGTGSTGSTSTVASRRR